MTGLDAFTAGMAGIAAVALAYRRIILHPGLPAWAGAPPAVQGAVSVFAAAMAWAALTICGGFQASLREAVVFTAIALNAVILAVNLHRNGRAPADAQSPEPTS